MKSFAALLIFGVVAAAAAATIALYDTGTQTRKCGPVPEALAALQLAENRLAVADVQYTDDEGRLRGLDEFRGRGLVLNFWATWCAPCVREMPSLDRLQAESPGGIVVLAVSEDRGGVPVVEAFYRKNRISDLAVAVDTGLEAARGLGVRGLPTTLLIDPAGREIGRLAGAAEWDSPEAVAFIRSCIGQEKGE